MSGYTLPSDVSPFKLALKCVNLFYHVLKLQKAGKLTKYLDQYCYVACFETLFSPVIKPLPHVISLLKTPYVVA